jgi:hypothetical protein
MLQADLGRAELRGLVGLQVHLLRARDVPGVVQRAGIAEIEAAACVRERGNVWPRQRSEADQRGQCRGKNARSFVLEPEPAKSS